MFGYVRIEKRELKFREYDLYRAHYCGVCHALRARHVLLPFALAHDCAFAALVAGACNPHEESIRTARCVFNPLMKVPCCKGPAEDFAADVNAFLAYARLMDSWRDDKNPVAFLAARLFSRCAAAASKRLGDAAACAQAQLDKLVELEAAGCGSLDDAANASARMLEALFSAIPAPGHTGDALRYLGFHLGRWVYLIDAWDDLAKDEKRGRYNVLLKAFGSAEAARRETERMRFNLFHALGEAARAAELLPADERVSIVLNVLDVGAAELTERLLIGEKQERKNREAAASESI